MTTYGLFVDSSLCEHNFWCRSKCQLRRLTFLTLGQRVIGCQSFVMVVWSKTNQWLKRNFTISGRRATYWALSVCNVKIYRKLKNIYQLEALGQCVPPPSHVLPVPPSGESVWAADLCPSTTLLSPNSDESGKQFLYPDDDPDGHRNLVICSLAHCQPSLKILCKSVRNFYAKLLTGKQTDKQTTTKHILLGGDKWLKNQLCFKQTVKFNKRCNYSRNWSLGVRKASQET